ncbi:MAG: efflux RND transporter periplasmic adaptor subunit [Campylobacterota bacterium]|nr:efflux RND transporter periplasmic adaptor subunit [Campylobacterota bacterium]
MRMIILMALLFGSLLNAEEIYATFDVHASRQSGLTLASSGVVKNIHVDVGSQVKAGSLLLELDNDELIQSLKLAEEEAKLAETEHRFAKKSYERYLQVKDVIDADQLDLYTLNYEKSLHILGRAKSALAYKKALLKKSRLYAPYDGIIAQRHVEVGDGVSSATMETLFTLINEGRVTLILRFDEKYWTRVKKGAKFEYRVDGLDQMFTGTIVKVYPAVEAKTRKAIAEVHTTGLPPGLFGDGMIKVD